MPGYRLTHAASQDITRIFVDGLALFGIDQAETYHAGLEAVFVFLTEYPSAARLRGEVSTPVRVYRHKSHLVVYELREDETVVILRVRHGREDWLSPSDEH